MAMAAPAPNSNFGMTTGVPSPPTGEVFDEHPNKFTIYLHQLAGSHDSEANVIIQDHCYARPWNWKPENVYAKPVKKIFFPKASNLCRSLTDCHRSEDEVDVETETNTKAPHQLHTYDPENLPQLPMDLNRPRKLMDEFQRIADFVKPEESLDDWEERIDKTFWSPVQTRIFTRVLKILSSERLARLVKNGSFDEPIFRRTSIDTAARRFREAMASAGWDIRIAQWLHCVFFEHLPHEYLPIYLDILQTLRAKIPQLIDKIISAQPNLTGKNGSITWETLGTLLKRSWDPVSAILNANKPKKLPGNPILVIAPSGSGATISSRQHKWISLLGTLGMVVNVPVHLGLAASKMTMMACIDQLVQATRTKIQDVRADCPGRPIVLVGFNSGAALACQIAQMELVTAVICIGFPFVTVEGKRGSPDDILMDMRCPVMFVIGQNANLARVEDIEHLRENMLVETNLVVVGSADDHLRITTAKKISESITQTMVDRCILDEIGDFVGNILLQPHPLPLRPVGPGVTVGNLAHLDSKPVKKDGDKRKNSTSSVESEPNSPNTKKSRPNTPVSSTAMAPLYPTNSSSTMPKTSIPVTQSAMSSAGAAAIKRKPRVMPPTHRSSFGDHNVNQKFSSQMPNNGSGGITLNIGSLASLAPIGPIRLGPNQTSTGTGTSSTKVPAMPPQPKIHPPKPPAKILQPGMSAPKIRTMLPTNTNKAFPKMPPNQFKQLPVNDAESHDPRLVNVMPSSSSQMRINNQAAMELGENEAEAAMKKRRNLQAVASDPDRQKAQKPLTKITVKAPKPPEVPDYDLGNILDLPIIFAKDDVNLSAIQVNPPEKRPTKVVLISNKQDKRPNPTSSVPSISRQPATNQASKYTKIILSKKRENKAENPVVLTKKTPVSRITQSSRIFTHEVASSSFVDDGFELDDAFSASAIQRELAEGEMDDLVDGTS